jgi:uncharacterized protein involved in copper resistance
MMDMVVSTIDEEQPSNMPPKEIDQRRMGVGTMIAVLMMHAVDRNPTGWRVLKRADPADCHRVFQPTRTLKSTVRQQAMIADRYAKAIEERVSKDRQDQATVRKIRRNQGQQTQQMNDGQ